MQMWYEREKGENMRKQKYGMEGLGFWVLYIWSVAAMTSIAKEGVGFVLKTVQSSALICGSQPLRFLSSLFHPLPPSPSPSL